MTITELEAWFKDRELPKELNLNKAVKVTDVPAFVESHLGIIKKNGTAQAFAGFHQRLLEIKILVEAAN